MNPIKKYGSSAAILFCAAITVLSVVARVIMYVKVRSLWLDEAMLAESIVTRDFGDLLSAPLLNLQTAPAAYLYVVKMFGSIFGYTEGALRIYSLFAFLGMITLEYFLLTREFKTGKVWAVFAVCLSSTLNLYMRYSNELKPYMGDAFFVLAVLTIYHLYKTEKIKMPVLIVAFCLILLFSSPALFFVASVFIVEFIFALVEKDSKRIGITICAGCVTLVFWIAYYVFWLMPVAQSDGMINFWKDNRFVLFTVHASEIKHNLLLIAKMLGKRNCLYFIFALAGLVVSLVRKNRVSFVIACSTVLLLVASSMEKYPIVNRLWMFTYVLNIMYLAICFDFAKHIPRCRAIVKYGTVILAFIFVVLNLNFIGFAKSGMYLNEEEANPLIEYVKTNIQEGDFLFSSSGSNHVLQFKNGYKAQKIGNVVNDNIIYESGPLSYSIEKIQKYKKGYILSVHITERTDALRAKLTELGYLHEVGSFYGTPLHYFTTDPDDPRRSEKTVFN